MHPVLCVALLQCILCSLWPFLNASCALCRRSEGIGLKAEVIAASFGKVSMQREEERAIGPMFFLRYIGALLRHYEEGFWLIVLAVLNSIPGLRQFASILGILRWAESRAASVAMCGNFRAHDVALSLLRMVSNNIGHIATMCAKQVCVYGTLARPRLGVRLPTHPPIGADARARLPALSASPPLVPARLAAPHRSPAGQVKRP